MSDRRQPWLTLVYVAVGILLTVVLGVYSFIKATSTPVHPDAAALPSVLQTTPLPEWADAVKQAQQIARAEVIAQNLPGLSVAVGVRGAGPGQGIVWAEGFGWADVAKRVPVAPNIRFRVGHTSKALTSAAVGLLLEQGRLRLDDEIQTYVPQFPRKQWPITLRQLMGHIAGIRHYRAESDYGLTTHCERAAEGLRSFADDPLRFEPGTQYGYSTYGWVLVSAAVEAAAGEVFFTFMRTKIFEPLGMTATTSDSVSDTIPDLTTFYVQEAELPRIVFGLEVAERVDYSCFAGAAGFLSTPSDLVRFGLAMNGGKLLTPMTVNQLQSPQQLSSGKETDYGLGWMLETDSLAGEPARVAGHSSRTPVGGTTSFLIFPDRGIVVAAMANTSYKSTQSMALKIAQAFAEPRKRPAGK